MFSISASSTDSYLTVLAPTRQIVAIAGRPLRQRLAWNGSRTAGHALRDEMPATAAPYHASILLRIWRSDFDHHRLDELNDFVESRSQPMFDSLEGCVGYAFAHRAGTYLAVTLWRDQQALAEAEATPLYRETVDAIVATGILRGTQHVEVLDVDALVCPTG